MCTTDPRRPSRNQLISKLTGQYKKKTNKKLMTSANSKCQGDTMEVDKFFFSVSLIRMVDSNQFPSFQLPQTLHMDNLKPQ